MAGSLFGGALGTGFETSDYLITMFKDISLDDLKQPDS